MTLDRPAGAGSLGGDATGCWKPFRRILCLTRRALPPLVACAAVVLAGAGPAAAGGGLAQATGGRPPEAGARPASVGGKVAGAVAVSTFVNVTRDPADDWLGEGIAETVAADLGSAGMTVVGRAAAPAGASDGGTDESPAGALARGRALGAQWIVTGGYQRLGDRLRITARLVNLMSGTVGRAVRADGTVQEFFALQDRIVDGLLSDADLNGAAALPAAAAARSAGEPAPATRVPDPAPDAGRAGGTLPGETAAGGTLAREAGDGGTLARGARARAGGTPAGERAAGATLPGGARAGGTLAGGAPARERLPETAAPPEGAAVPQPLVMPGGRGPGGGDGAGADA